MKRSMNNNKGGSVHVWAALVLPLLIGFMGLTIDLGYILVVGQQLQTGADAGALAGARHLKSGIYDVQQAAVAVAGANEAAGSAITLGTGFNNAPDGDIVVGYFDRDTRTFTPDSSNYNAVQVRAQRTAASAAGDIPMFFATFFGVNSIDMSRTAIAMQGGGTGAGLIVLSPHDRDALAISGSVDLNVENGAIQVNSDHARAAYIGGSVTGNAQSLNIVGGLRTSGNPDLPDTVNLGVDPIPDPLANLPAPTWDAQNDLGGVSMNNGTATLQPGYYSGGIHMTGGTATLNPGVYILDGAGLDITGNAQFYAEGVTFYIVGSGEVDISGTGDVFLSGPDPEVHFFPEVAIYEGLSVFQSRTNAHSGRIIGGSSMILEGTYYFPANHMDLGGESQTFGNQLIVHTADVFGNGTLTITYDGRNPAPGSRVFLVG